MGYRSQFGNSGVIHIGSGDNTLLVHREFNSFDLRVNLDNDAFKNTGGTNPPPTTDQITLRVDPSMFVIQPDPGPGLCLLFDANAFRKQAGAGLYLKTQGVVTCDTNGVKLLTDPNSFNTNPQQGLQIKTSQCVNLGSDGLYLNLNPLEFQIVAGQLALLPPVPVRSALGPAPGLGALAFFDQADWNSQIKNLPDLTVYAKWSQLGNLATKNMADWNVDISNLPDLTVYELKGKLRPLAYKAVVDYSTTDVINKPTLGTLAAKSSVDYTTADVANKPDLTVYELKTNLKPLAYKAAVDYNTTDVINKPDFANFAVDLLPATTNVRMLGSTTRYWNTLYATYLYTSTLYAKAGTLYAANTVCPSLDNNASLGTSSVAWSAVNAYTVTAKTSVTAPNLKALSGMDTLDYASTYLINKPTLGTLAAKSNVDYNTDVINKPAGLSAEYSTATRQTVPASSVNTVQTNYVIPPAGSAPFTADNTTVTYKSIGYSSSATNGNAFALFDQNASTFWAPTSANYTGANGGAATSAPAIACTLFDGTTTTFNGDYVQLYCTEGYRLVSVDLTNKVAWNGSAAAYVKAYGSVDGAKWYYLSQTNTPTSGVTCTLNYPSAQYDSAVFAAASHNFQYYRLQVPQIGVQIVQFVSLSITADVFTEYAITPAVTASKPQISQPTLVDPMITGGLEMPGDGQLGPPRMGSRSPGSKMVVYPNGSNYVAPYVGDYAVGMESAHMWFSTDAATTDRGFKFYGGSQTAARIGSTGEFESLKVITPSIELGTPAWNGSWFPNGADTYIDFHATPTTGASPPDYDARIIRMNGAGGDLQILQTGGVIRLTTAGGGKHILMDGTGHFYPTTDNAQMLGAGNVRWSSMNAVTVYSANGTVQTSDENAKLDLLLLPEPLGLEFVNHLAPITYTFKAGPSDQKTRMGFGARATQEVLEGKGYPHMALVDQSSEEWGLTYTELLAPLVKAVQQLSQQNADLQQRVSVLEGATRHLLSKVSGVSLK